MLLSFRQGSEAEREEMTLLPSVVGISQLKKNIKSWRSSSVPVRHPGVRWHLCLELGCRHPVFGVGMHSRERRAFGAIAEGPKRHPNRGSRAAN